MSAFGDAQVLQNPNDNGWLGLGGVILCEMWREQAIFYSTQKYMDLLPITRCLTWEARWRLGFNALVGQTNESIQKKTLLFRSQWNGKFLM